MTRIPAKNWQERPLSDWNVTTYHAFLIDENKRLFNADYVPFGKGSITNRWSTEKGQLKTAQGNYGNAVLKRFIERCLDKHRPTQTFPHINFGFMWAYLRDEMPRAQADIARESKRKEAMLTRNDGMTDDELMDLL